MVYLELKVGENVKLGDNIRITITQTEASKGKCRIGIEAPKEVPIFRKEILDQYRNHLQGDSNA